MSRQPDLLALLRGRLDRPATPGVDDSGAGARGESGSSRSSRSSRVLVPPPATPARSQATSPLAAAAGASSVPFTRQVALALQQHVAVSVWFVSVSAAAVVLLLVATYALGVKRGETRAREALLAQEEPTDDSRRGLTAALDVRVPKTMQQPQAPSTTGSTGDAAERAKAGAGNSAGNGPEAATPPKPADGLRLGLQLVTYSDTKTGRERADDMRQFLKRQGFDDVMLVQGDQDGMLCVLVPVADTAPDTVSKVRSRVKALPAPPFAKTFDFAKQTLPLMKVKL